MIEYDSSSTGLLRAAAQYQLLQTSLEQGMQKYSKGNTGIALGMSRGLQPHFPWNRGFVTRQ